MHLDIKKEHNYKLISMTIVLIFISIIGFMLKLPVPFRKIDKEMHFLFYFLVSAFINFLFSKGKFRNHLIILFILVSFGFFIEYFQQYSNRFFHKRVHGNFDIQDIKYNMIGLLLFSLIWIKFYILQFLFNKK